MSRYAWTARITRPTRGGYAGTEIGDAYDPGDPDVVYDGAVDFQDEFAEVTRPGPAGEPVTAFDALVLFPVGETVVGPPGGPTAGDLITVTKGDMELSGAIRSVRILDQTCMVRWME